MVPPIGFQGLLNKWVHINKSNPESGRKKSSRTLADEESMKSGNTATSTVSGGTGLSSTIHGYPKSEGHGQDERTSLKTSRHKSSFKKLTKTDSYSDILRKKREKAEDGSTHDEKDMDSFWLDPSDDRNDRQPAEPPSQKSVDNERVNKWGEVIPTHGNTTTMQQRYYPTPLNNMQTMEVTLEQLFNPLAPSAEMNHALTRHNSIPSALSSSGSTDNSAVNMPHEHALHCPSAPPAPAPHPITQDVSYPAETQHIPRQAYSYHHAKTQYNTTIYPCPNCINLEHKLNDMHSRLEYYRRLRESSSTAATVCQKCGVADTSAKKQGGSLRQRQITPPVPIFSRHDVKSVRQHNESIALMEASQRLVEFMTMHKRQMEQLNRERAQWQDHIHLKLNYLTNMCQEVRSRSTSTTSPHGEKTQDPLKLQSERDALALEVEILRTQMALLSNKEETPIFHHQQHGTMSHCYSTNTLATNASSTNVAAAGGGELVRVSSFDSRASSHGSMNDLMFNLDEV